MTEPEYISELINDSHELASFQCGVAELDDWLKRSALNAHRQGLCRVRVWREPGSSEVLAYYATVPTVVAAEELPGRGRAGNAGAIPGYLIAKLALHNRLQKQHYGSELLLDALEMAAAAANLAGGRVVVVDAINEDAYNFYLRCGLLPTGPGSQRLSIRVSSIITTIGSVRHEPTEEPYRDAALNFSWAYQPPPALFLVLQPEPVAHEKDGKALDAVRDIFRSIGFTELTTAHTPLPGASGAITCRIDSPTHLTVLVADGARQMAPPIPHGNPELTAALNENKSVEILVTTHSLDDAHLISRKLFLNDIAAGGFLGANVRVV